MRRPSLNPSGEFGKWLDTKIQAQKIGLTALAKRTRLSAGHISMIRSGQRQASPLAVEGLARALGAENDLDLALELAGHPVARAASGSREDAAARHMLSNRNEPPSLDGDSLLQSLTAYASIAGIPMAVLLPQDKAAIAVPSDSPNPKTSNPDKDACALGNHQEFGPGGQAAGKVAALVVTVCKAGRSHIVFPLHIGDRMVGTLVTGGIPGKKDERRLAQLRLIVHQAANTITRDAEVQRRRAHAAAERFAVEEIAASLTPRLSVEEALCRILDGVWKLIPF